MAITLDDLQRCQCIATTVKNLPCKNHIRLDELVAVSEGIIGIHALATKEKEAAIAAAIKGLMCTSHREKQSKSQVDDLAIKYKSAILEYSKICRHLELEEPRPWLGNSKTTILTKLPRVINLEQFSGGFIYAFTQKSRPGFVKVGCAKRSVAQRCKDWARCYPAANLEVEMQTSFPQRVEELIHLQLHGFRYEIRCDTCDVGRHTEWFKCSLELIENTIRDWVLLMNANGLYDIESRQLSARWDGIVSNLVNCNITRITAKVLLEAQANGSMTTDLVVEESLARLCL